MNTRKRALAAILMGATLSAASWAASDCCDPASPFREGEGWAETPATCETLASWAAKAPMVIRGKLSGVHATEMLAYLEMCEPKGLRVVCVTYQTNGMQKGEVVTFASGYQRNNNEWVMLDPCLASR